MIYLNCTLLNVRKLLQVKSYYVTVKMSGVHNLSLESPLILLIAYLKPLDTATFVEAPAR